MLKELKEFEKQVKELETKAFVDFSLFENEYINLINRGKVLRKQVLMNSQNCTPQTIDWLLNKNTDIETVQEEYKCLKSILDLTKELLKGYENRAEELFKQNEYLEVIKIYYQMFDLTDNPLYKKKIALVCHLLENSEEILNDVKKDVAFDKDFYWELSEKFHKKRRFYKSLCYVKKAIEMEKEMVNKNKIYL